ncbi:MAG: pitrilysin family protein [Bacteroidales bacterium]|jgi:predicted Zn-dependent peptidase|nr:pitrilysin family protein [Bacteroidales bacterium]
MKIFSEVMILFDRIVLDNGLKVIVHEDTSTPLVAMNILYNVGSRDEDPVLTGLAHLFEHLMYGGSVNIPEYDLPLQQAGGDNNAFTTNDITNFYLTVPSANIETGFWLESDRMYELDFSQKKLNVQKNVVIEEYKQRYLNQPYGDAMLMIKPMAYKFHPYRWPTIGMDIKHIENACLSDIKEFFFSHYAPNNAIITLAGNIKSDRAFKLAEKWFGPISSRKIKARILPKEPAQTEERTITVERNVPATAIYKVWHIGPRNGEHYHSMDLLTDILAGGESGRLHTRLVREKNLFTEINAYITSDIDPGLAIVQGRLMNGIEVHEAVNALDEIITELKTKPVPENEMEKVRNRFEASNVLSNTSILNKAMNLSYYELLGDASEINLEVENYRRVSSRMVRDGAMRFLNQENSCTLYYLSNTRLK